MALCKIKYHTHSNCANVLGFFNPVEVQGGEKAHHKDFTWGITVNGYVFKDFAMCLCRNV